MVRKFFWGEPVNKNETMNVINVTAIETLHILPLSAALLIGSSLSDEELEILQSAVEGLLSEHPETVPQPWVICPPCFRGRFLSQRLGEGHR